VGRWTSRRSGRSFVGISRLLSFTDGEFWLVYLNTGGVMASAMVHVKEGHRMLAQACTLADVKKVCDVMVAARHLIEDARLGRENVLQASEIALLAERKAGQLLKQLDRAKPKPTGGRVRNSEYNQALKDSKIGERTAQRWQELADVPEMKIKEYVAHVRGTETGAVTRQGLNKFICGTGSRTQAHVLEATLEGDTDKPDLKSAAEKLRIDIESILDRECDAKRVKTVEIILKLRPHIPAGIMREISEAFASLEEKAAQYKKLTYPERHKPVTPA
jgi:hypothetical protein